MIPEPERLHRRNHRAGGSGRVSARRNVAGQARALTKSERAIIECTGFHCAILLRGYHGTGCLLISKWQS